MDKKKSLARIITRKVIFKLILALGAFFVLILIVFVAMQIFGKKPLTLGKFIRELTPYNKRNIRDITLQLFNNVFLSFSISSALSAFLSYIFSKKKALYTYVISFGVILKATPLIVLLPLIQNIRGIKYTWLVGNLGLLGGVLISFFPTFVEAVSGFSSYPRHVFQYYKKIIRFNKYELFLIKLRFALSYLFPAFKVCFVLSVVGCIVGELVIPSENNIAAFITRAATYTNMNMQFVALIICSIIGILGFSIIDSLEYIFSWWEERDASQE